MSDTTVRRSFRFSTGTLIRVAQRLSGALNDPIVGPSMVDYLSAAHVADFTAQIALVVRLADDQSGAFGKVSMLTSSQQKALRALHRHARATRRKAKFVFARQDTVLHSEFQVGQPTSQSMAATLDRSRKTLAAARKYAAEFSARNWPASATNRLEHAVETLTSLDLEHERTKDEKLGLTAQYITAANLLYEECITIQDAARIVYPKDEEPVEPLTVEARGRFLLGEFPPRETTAVAATDASAVTQATIEPLAPAESAEPAPARREVAGATVANQEGCNEPSVSAGAREKEPDAGLVRPMSPRSERSGQSCESEWVAEPRWSPEVKLLLESEPRLDPGCPHFGNGDFALKREVEDGVTEIGNGREAERDEPAIAEVRDFER